MSTPPAGGPPDRVVILGLGLIGGSLARDLAALDVPVAAADLDPARVTAALYEGVVRESLDPRAPELRARDLVVLAVPVGAAPELVRHLAPLLPPDAVLTDVGSTKRDIVAAARAAGIPGRFVGAHPMAGSHTAGWSASRQGLFRDARVWLCPAAASAEAHHRVRAMWESVGARPEIVDPDDHDRHVAWSSHLPQAVSSALGAVLHQAGIPPDALGPGGRDVTRLSRSDPRLWTDIALANADQILPALAATRERIAALEAALGGDTSGEGGAERREAVRRWFAEGGG